MKYPRLIADIGGTNARFTIEVAPFVFEETTVLACADYATLSDAIHAYLAMHHRDLPAHVGIAIATPVSGDFVQMTNHHWQFSISAMREALQVETLWVINDFTAQALAITQMQDDDITHLNGTINDGKKPTNAHCAVIGAGTGLGVSGLIANGRGGFLALAGEGGHATFAPTDALECELMAFASPQFGGHVSAERILQGDGLSLLYRFFAMKNGQTQAKPLSPAEVTHGALHDNDPLCQQVLSRYCAILGGFCANVVLTLGAVGGVYLAGGIVPRFIPFLRDSDFRTQFEAKGRFADYLRDVPVYVVEHPHPGLLGTAVALNDVL